MKVVINKCCGGFSLSKKAFEFLGLKWEAYGTLYGHDINRHDPKLVSCVKTLGDEANGVYAKLGVVEIPDNIEYEIMEYDGIEHIAEKHKT